MMDFRATLPKAFSDAHKAIDDQCANQPVVGAVAQGCVWAVKPIAYGSELSTEGIVFVPASMLATKIPYGLEALKILTVAGTGAKIGDTVYRVSSPEDRGDLAMRDFMEIGLGGYASARAMSSQQLLYSTPNSQGGRVWISRDSIQQRDFAYLVSRTRGQTRILSGLHGGRNGEIMAEPKFYNEDFRRWGFYSRIKVVDASGFTADQWQQHLSGGGDIICAWCYSESSLPLSCGLGYEPPAFSWMLYSFGTASGIGAAIEAISR
jgi:hypothetical protein